MSALNTFTVTTAIVLGVLWGADLPAQPISACPTGVTPSGSTGVLLTEAAEGGPEISMCTVPPGFAAPLVTTAVALTDNPKVVPPVISDLVVFTPDPARLITFFSDPPIPTDIMADLTQTEAAHNVVALNGTTYVITSDTPVEGPEIPEPATALLVTAAIAVFALKHRFPRRFTS
jgi:hypothetical protein